MNDPLVVVGAGPVGLAAAAQAEARGLSTLVLEAGDSAGAAVLEWGHVRLFSPWSELVAPLAELLATRPDVEIRYGHRVVGVARGGRDRLVTVGRAGVPFSVHVEVAG